MQRWAHAVILNALTGFLSWQALGRPEWMTPAALGEKVEGKVSLKRAAVDDLEPDLRPVTRDAVLRFREGIHRLSREAFKGVSGGRSTTARVVAELLGANTGYSGIFTSEMIEGMLQKEEEETNERVGAGKMRFVAKRQGLPKESALIPVEDWLQQSWSEVLEDPTERLLDPCPIGSRPRRYHAADPGEWEAFVGRKAGARMMVAVSVSKVPKGPGGELLWSGVFPVPKSWDEDRSIDGRRKMNWRERKWPGRKPGHGAHYTKGVLKKGRRRRYNVFDAPHFYHNIHSGRKHITHNPTGPPISRQRAAELGLEIIAEYDDGGDMVQPVTVSIVMGDAKGVTLATEAHLNMLKSVGLDERWLTCWEGPDPDRGVRASLCIDDFLLEEDIPEEMADEEETPEDVFMQGVYALYQELGIPPKESKIQLRKREVISLGASVDGDGGRVGVPWRTLSQTILLTMAVVMGTPVTRNAAQKVLGLWTFALMFRRDLFCSLECLYSEIDALSETEARPMGSRAKEEFMTLVSTAICMSTNMRWEVSTTMFATDAEGTGGSAIVRTEVTQGFAEELFRYSQVTREYARLEGDAAELEAKTRLEERVAAETKKLQECPQKSCVVVKQLDVDDPEETYPGQRIGRAVLEKRRQEGKPVASFPDHRLPPEEEKAKNEKGRKWRRVMCNPEMERCLREVSEGNRTWMKALQVGGDGDETRDAVEACGDVAPREYLCRCVLAWGALQEDLSRRLESKDWKVVRLDTVLQREQRKGRAALLEALERLCWEGAFGGWVQIGKLPAYVKEIREIISRCRGFYVHWSYTDVRSGLRWVDGEAEAPEMWIGVDPRLKRMLVGAKDDDDLEDCGKYLPGRWGAVTRKSLVQAIEEQMENVGSTRSVKRRAWSRNPWETRLGQLVEVMEWQPVLNWKDARREDEHTNVLEMRAKRKLGSRLARRRRYHGKRYLHLTDSRVGQAVTGRGRSS